MQDQLESSSKLVPRIFYDLIARIVPGTLVLFLYFHDEITDSPEWSTITVGIILAYSIGLVLEKSSDLLLTPCLRKLQRSRRRNQNKDSGRPRLDYSSYSEGSIWKWINNSTDRELPRLLKLMAEKNSLRSMLALASFLIALQIGLFIGLEIHSPVESGFLQFLSLTLIFLALLAAHWHADHALCANFRAETKGNRTTTQPKI